MLVSSPTPHCLSAVKKTLLLGNSSIRGVSGSWIIVSAVVFWSYSGTLVSLLAVRFIPQPIQTLRNLLDDHSIAVIMEPNTIVTDTISVGFPLATFYFSVSGRLITTAYCAEPSVALCAVPHLSPVYLQKMKSGELRELHELQYVGRVLYQHASTFPRALDTLVRRQRHVIISTSLSAELFMADIFTQTGTT